MADEITSPDSNGQLEKQASSVSIPCCQKYQKLIMFACCCAGVVIGIVIVFIGLLIWKFTAPAPNPYANYPPPPPPPPQQVPAVYAGPSATDGGSFDD